MSSVKHHSEIMSSKCEYTLNSCANHVIGDVKKLRYDDHKQIWIFSLPLPTALIYILL